MEHSLARDPLAPGRRPGARVRERILRRGRVRHRHRPQDAHRPADRGRPSRARARCGAPSPIRTATSPPRSSASRWPASASAGLASRRSPSLIQPLLHVPAGGHRGSDRAQHRGRHRLCAHHRAAHHARRARAEDDRARSAPKRRRCSSSSRPSSSCSAFWPFIRLLNGMGRGIVSLLGMQRDRAATRWCTPKRS